MDDDTIQDLKQFIAATISQQTSEFEERFDKIDKKFDKVDKRFDTVDGKIDDLSASVADAVENSNEASDTQLKDHEKRIVRLEHKAA